jgi:hypothetical protein
VYAEIDDGFGKLREYLRAWARFSNWEETRRPTAGPGTTASLSRAQEWLMCTQLPMGRAGIEPATLGLKVPCSTN